jgi:hypothetical protein
MAKRKHQFMLRTAAVGVVVTCLSMTSALAAQPTGTLTLACQGTTADFGRPDDKEPLSTGIIINFATQTIVGLDAPSNSSIKILDMDEVTVSFGGGSSYPEWSIAGSINRVTGDVEATSTLSIAKTHKKIQTSISLKCKPTQRMF